MIDLQSKGDKMSRENTASVDMTNGKRIAHNGRKELAALKRSFSKDNIEQKEQTINAKKGVNLALKKAKAKKRAKLAKASKKKNKK